MADEQVGTVSVKAIPDTKGFAKKLKAYLEALERQLDVTVELGVELSKRDVARVQTELRALTKDLTVKVKVELDKSGFDAAFRSMINRTQKEADSKPIRPAVRPAPWDLSQYTRELNQQIEKTINDLKAEIPVGIWSQGFTRDLDRMKAELNRLQDQKVRLDIDDQEFRAKYQALMASINEEVSRLKIDIDSENARQQLDRLIQQMKEKSIELPIQLDGYLEAAATAEELARDRHMTIHARVSMDRTLAQIAAITSAYKIDIGAQIDRSSFGQLGKFLAGLSGMRMIKRISTDLTDLIRNIDIILPKVATFSTAIAGIGAVGLTAVGGIVGLAEGLGRMLRGALLLPAALAGMASAMTILSISFQDAKNHIPDVINQFQSLRPVISGGFWSTAADNVRNFTNSFIPLANTWLPRVSAAMGDVLGDIADSLTAFTNDGGMQTFFRNMQRGVEASRKGFGSLTTALLDLVEAGSKHFPAIGRAFSDTMGTFQKWTARITSDGSFDRWMKQAAEAAMDFGSILMSTGRIFGAFAKASRAAGGPTLSSMADGLERVADAANSARSIEALTTLFEGAYQSVQNMVPGLKNLGNAFLDLAPAISKSMSIAGSIISEFFDGLSRMISDPRFADGMVKMFEGFHRGMENLSPIFDTLGADMGMLMSTFGLLADVIGRVVGVASKELGILFQDLLRIVDALIPVLGDWLVGAIEAIAPAIRAAADALADFVEKFPELAAGIAIAVAAIGIITTVIGALARPFMTAVAAVIRLRDMFGSFSGAASKLAGPLSRVWGIVSRLGGVFLRVAGWVGLAVGAFAWMYSESENLRNAVSRLWDALKNLGQSVWEAVGPEFDKLANETLPNLKDSALELLDKLGPVGKFLGDTLAGDIDSLAKAIEDATPAISEFAENSARELNTVAEKTTEVSDGMNNFLEDAGTAVEGVQALFEGDWATAWEKFKTAATSQISELDGAFGTFGSGMSGTVMALVDTIIPLMIDLGKGMIAGFLTAFLTEAGNMYLQVQLAFENVKRIIATFITETIINFTTLPGRIVATLGILGENLRLAFETAFNLAKTAVLTFVADLILEFQTLPMRLATLIGTGAGILLGAFLTWMLSLWTTVLIWLNNIKLLFQNLPGQIMLALSTFVENLRNWATTAINAAKMAFVFGIAQIVMFFALLPGRVMTAVATLAGRIRAWANNVINGAKITFVTGIANIVSYFAQLPGRVMAAIANLAGRIRAWASNTINGAKIAFVTGIANIVADFAQMPGRVMSAISALVGMLRNWATNAINGAKAAFIIGIGIILSEFRALPGKIVAALGNAAGRLAAVGRDMIQGLINGIKSKAAEVAGAARSVVTRAINAAKAALRINSPSKVFIGLGEYTGEGYIKGMEHMRNGVDKTARKLVAAPSVPDIPEGAVASAPGAAGAGVASAPMDELLAAVGNIKLIVDGRELHTTVEDLKRKFTRR